MSSSSDQLLRSAEYRQAGYWGDDTFPVVIDRWADDDPRRPYLSDGASTLS
jgi:non-ribosomal peptide synthetase component E (peptide arylation enzyme)